MDHKASGDAPSVPQLLGRWADAGVTAARALLVWHCGAGRPWEQ